MIFFKKNKTNKKELIIGFDEKKFLEANPDIKEAIDNGTNNDVYEHLEKFSLEEIRQGIRKFHLDFEPFNEVIYLNCFSDIKEAVEKEEFKSAFEHFCLFGYKEIINGIREWNSFIADMKQIVDVITKSELFDKDFYVSVYPDVKNYNISPIWHYVLYGWKEGKNPSEDFDTSYYLKRNSDIIQYNINPFYHYILYGKGEGRITKSPIVDYVKINNTLSFFKKEKYIPTINVDKPIEILIPVYNGYEFLEPLLKSIIKNTFIPFRVLICDDRSPDKKVYPFLKQFVKDYKDFDILLFQNEKNKGFVNTINKLAQYVENHFVILNTDTEVPPFWLERLMAPIFRDDSVASTTPFTNAGTICSFPNYLEDNPIFENLTVEAIDDSFTYIDDTKHIEIPTGVGFCMGVNKNVVDKLGMFDTVFGKGYGEENDFCQRAIANGYRNLHIPNLFVYHKHGGSFLSEEKQRLINQNSKILLERYPNYDYDVQQTIKKNRFKHLRDFIKLLLLSNKYKSFLFFDHNLGGGANHYLDDKIKDIQTNDEKSVIFLIRYDFQNEKGFLIETIYQKEVLKYYAETFDELKSFLGLMSYNEIFINSLVSYNNIQDMLEFILTIKEFNKAKLIVPIHDYFPVCPNYNLLNENYTYCNIPTDCNDCINCLIKNSGEFKIFEQTIDIKQWRKNWSIFLEKADEILCFSTSSKNIVKKAYNDLDITINVIPHDINSKYDKIYDANLKNKKQKIIGILGGINIPKGALIVKELVEFIEKNNLNIKVVLIGNISEKINSPVFYETGRYKPEELPELVKKLGITEFLIPSICPETYSYTTDEIMQLGYPLSVFDIGAPVERVKKYENGNIISSLDEFLSELSNPIKNNLNGAKK